MPADKGSDECKRLLEQYGKYRKNTDGFFDPVRRRWVPLIEAAGEADARLMAANFSCFIEHKRGLISRFAFADWRENQREFAIIEKRERGIETWLFLIMGKSIADKKYPRKAWLMPHGVMLEVIAEDMETKSLAHERASERLKEYELTWKSDWAFPEHHEFLKRYPRWNREAA